MRITRRSSIQSPAVGGTTAAGNGGTRSSSTGATGDSVELSDAARTLQRLRAEIGDLDAIATDAVQALQQRVDSNEYHPAPRVVAKRLLTELASDLLA
jgi:anti-sigma28 factor (negative regulator of flagellin synthesis)